MTDDSGIMSVDFLVGFTIFILAFIWVATMIPGLFIGVQSHTIDYDAVAYRTGVILVEDPGNVADTVEDKVPWELQKSEDNIARFGLAVSKDTPGILDAEKVNRFFNTADYPDFTYNNYSKRAIFGDYPYRFNISLQEAGTDTVRSVGDIIPEYSPYGYIRRDVKIRSSSNSTIGKTIIDAYHYTNTEEVQLNQFAIMINNSHLLNDQVGTIKNQTGDAAYRIDPQVDMIVINITDVDATRDLNKYPNPPTISVSDVKFYKRSYGETNLGTLFISSASYNNFLYVDGGSTPVPLPADFTKDLTMVFEPGFFITSDPDDTIFVNLTFEIDPPQQFLNNTHTQAFYYNYNPANVTQPELKDAVLEVAVW
ncbi:MAG: hypothetical protein WCX22_03375 [Methanoregula sp.]